jgi:hypothetical protein
MLEIERRITEDAKKCSSEKKKLSSGWGLRNTLKMCGWQGITTPTEWPDGWKDV